MSRSCMSQVSGLGGWLVTFIYTHKLSLFNIPICHFTQHFVVYFLSYSPAGNKPHFTFPPLLLPPASAPP